MGSGGWEVHLVLECLQTAFPSGRCPWVSDNCNHIPHSTCMYYIHTLTGNAIESSVDLPEGGQPPASSNQPQQSTDDARGVQVEDSQPSSSGTQDSLSSDRTALEEGLQTTSSGAQNTSDGQLEGEGRQAGVGGSHSTGSQSAAETVGSQSAVETVGSQSAAETVGSLSAAETVGSQSAAETMGSQSAAEEHENVPEERPLQRGRFALQYDMT